MKFSSIAALGGMATLASAGWAEADPSQPSMYSDTTSSATGAESYATAYAATPPSGYDDHSPSHSIGKKTHKVDVGALGQLIFSPNQVEAAVGDVIEFNFLAKNHSVTQSDFATPCTKNNGFDSDFMPNPNNETGVFRQSLTIKDTKPMWFYCKQPNPVNHCGQGMVFGINPAGKMDQFIENAEKQNGNLPGASAPTASTMAPVPKGQDCATPTYTGAITTVTVGLEKGKVLKFDPPFLQHKKKGDMIRFDFRAANHTLTESSFNDPCKKLDGTNIDTNFMNANKEDVPNAKPFDLVLDTDADKPRWFYCKQANGQPNGHCANGMVFAINPKSEGQFNEFLMKAKATLPKIKGRGLELGQMW